jgi:CO/xanthine dehydrogenase FAD-binding subunit
MRPFGYARPSTLAEAVAMLAADPAAVPLMGGTDLVIGLRDGSVKPTQVVDLKGIAELGAAIRVDADHLVIGARAMMEDIARDERVRRDFTALAEAAAVVGSVQIRNRATLPGNIVNASPAGDTLPALLVFDARVVCAGPDGERRVSIDEFLVGPGVTRLRRGELVTGVELPLPLERRGSVHLRRTRRRGHDLASVTLACVADEGGRIRLSYGSLGPRPVLVDGASATLADRRVPEDERVAALAPLLAQAQPSARSMRASPAYRLAMLRVLAVRGIDDASRRLSEGFVA